MVHLHQVLGVQKGRKNVFVNQTSLCTFDHVLFRGHWPIKTMPMPLSTLALQLTFYCTINDFQQRMS